MGLIIHASNVHQGGGAVLLRAVLATWKDMPCLVFLDDRMQLPEGLPTEVTVVRVRPNILARFLAERSLRRCATVQDTVLCFGNLPPLLKLEAKVVVFLQNRFLVEKISLQKFPVVVRLRITLERFWLRWRRGCVDAFIVQTPLMRSRLLQHMGVDAAVVPFSERPMGYSRSLQVPPVGRVRKYDFIYVATGEPHKNHRKLVEAWCLLATEGLFPSLCLTIDETKSVELYRWVDNKKNQFSLKIENLGVLTHDKTILLYSEAQALIYPSTLESFGLPLIEARQAGLPVLASELDYVRDVLDPEQAFDPESPLSIARAVKRFMGFNDDPLPLINAVDFMKYILDKCE